MVNSEMIPYPIMFNPVKHHLAFIKGLIHNNIHSGTNILEIISHAGTSVTDIYTGYLGIDNICGHVLSFLSANSLSSIEVFRKWTGEKRQDFRKIVLTDGSEWTLKYFNNSDRYVHLFPARYSINSVRVKATSLKTAVFWLSQPSVNEINLENLNRVRFIAHLSPVKSLAEVKALTDMIALLDNGNL
jgi:hypothetical protein